MSMTLLEAAPAPQMDEDALPDAPMPTTRVLSIMPRTTHYTVPTRLVAIAVAHTVADAIHTNSNIDARVNSLIEFYDVKVPAGVNFGERITDTLVKRTHPANGASAQNSQSAADQLVAAVIWESSRILGQRTQVRGWIPGHLTSLGIPGKKRRFVELTGVGCPQCRINPSCHGADRTKIRCLNQEDCGWDNSSAQPTE